MKKIFFSIIVLLFLFSTMATGLVQPSHAVRTVPTVMNYEGILKDLAGDPITSQHEVRFSIWFDSDFEAVLDLDPSGAINLLADSYSGYSEVYTVIPDERGFFQVEIGSVTPIPDFNIANHMYLQVDVKASGADDSAYEAMDIDGVDNNNDRQAIGTIPYSSNADFIDNAELGLSMGDIVQLEFGDIFPESTTPGGTNIEYFQIDADDSSSADVTQLSFGSLLMDRILSYDPEGYAPDDGWFDFSDDVNIRGRLTVSGTVNEVPVGWQYKSLRVEPEYPNAVVQEFSGLNNRGKLESHYVDEDGVAGPNNYNYYQWTTRQASLQTMDLVLKIKLPNDFSGFQNVPLEFRYRTADNDQNHNRVDVFMDDSQGVPVNLTGNSSLNNLSFQKTNISINGGTFLPETEVTIYIRLSAADVGAAYASDLAINYIGY